jgi:hypothetical protein
MLRGLAACTVLICGLLSVRVPERRSPKWLILPLFYTLWAGFAIGNSAHLPTSPAIYLVPIGALLVWHVWGEKKYGFRTWFALMVLPYCALGSAITLGSTLPPLAACAICCAISTRSIWRTAPAAFRLESATGPAVAKWARRDVVSSPRPTAAKPAFPWNPVFASVFSWAYIGFGVQFPLGGFGDSWQFTVLVLAGIWLAVRQKTRWLHAVPVNRQAVLAVTLVPLILVQAGSFLVGVQVGPRNLRPLNAQAQIAELVAMTAATLVTALALALYDWRPLRRVSASARQLTLLILVVGSFVAHILLPARIDPGFHQALQSFGSSLPSVLYAAAPGAALIAALWWVTVKVYENSELAAKQEVARDGPLV